MTHPHMRARARTHICKFQGSQNSADKDSRILGYNAM